SVLALILYDRHVFALRKAMLVEPVSGVIIFLVFRKLVVKGPAASGAPAQVPAFALPPNMEADDGAVLTMDVGYIRIECAVVLERSDNRVAHAAIAVRVRRLTRELQTNAPKCARQRTVVLRFMHGHFRHAPMMQ